MEKHRAGTENRGGIEGLRRSVEMEGMGRLHREGAELQGGNYQIS
ncbi:MAG: hypothetical protein AAGA77_16330 [Bacteroidota bacterium]